MQIKHPLSFRESENYGFCHVLRGKTIILNKQEKESLLSEISSRDMYNAVMAFIDTVKHRDNRPYSLEQYRKLAEKAVADAKRDVNYTSIEDMRNLFPQ